ncbi:hypothetical protein E3N88_42931 [Mikania micrantha]|uniref:Retrotransposon Copia-like N-terminal domain-containing protein n=1 Tax=Mikania micrantha TaxID=192012 RepID=A0A5N6LGE4_9ASTR|nr:hypothetical protein E3N88_42931 [Mikania micrantha]
MTPEPTPPPPPTQIIQITASNFLIRLTNTNFSSWRKQVQSALIGLKLDCYILGDTKPPAKFLASSSSTPNPEYDSWFRQDQTILSALLGSCSDPIQPLISSAETSREAWDRLITSFANTSRSRILSLKAKLASNPKGTRSVIEFLQDMKRIADELALVQAPVTDEDLLIHITCQLGEEYQNIVAALRARDNPVTFPELFEKLVDHERMLKQITPQLSPPAMTTVNYTNRQTRSGYRTATDNQNFRQNAQGRAATRSNRNQYFNSNSGYGSNRMSRNNIVCHLEQAYFDVYL